MESIDQVQAIRRAVDSLQGWMQIWQRAMLFADMAALAHDDCKPPPVSVFDLDRNTPSIPDQPALDQVTRLAAEMVRAAERLTADVLAGAEPTRSDYDAVMTPYWRLCDLLLRLDRAFALAESTIDLLTGLKTRRAMMSDLAGEFDRQRRLGQPFTVAMCDIDRFKSINDTYGHQAGDQVLSAVAAIVSENIRSFDDAYRMGGEEFLIALKGTDLDIGLLVVERLRDELARRKLDIIGKDGSPRELTVTASFGVAAAGLHAKDVDGLLLAADKALYHAKEAGRNCTKVAAEAA